MPLIFDLSANPLNGTYTIEDDGVSGNGVSVIRDPNGVVTPFSHPADSLTIISRAGQNIDVNITDHLAAADFTIGSLTSSTPNPDNIRMAGTRRAPSRSARTTTSPNGAATAQPTSSPATFS
jgi:hypothetical protein